jgi:Putative adhesin
MPRLRSRATVVATAAALSAAVAFIGAGVFADHVLARDDVRESTVGGHVERLVVEAEAGDVEVVSSADGAVRIRATRHYLFDRPAVNSQLTDGTLTIEPSCGGWWRGGGCAVDLRIEVPAGTAIDVNGSAGDVDVRGLDGTGDVVADSDAGDVTVDLTGVPTRVRATTDAGDVTVRVPPGAYEVQADTDAGEARVDGLIQDDRAPRVIEADSAAGDVRVSAAGR